ncbi:hypothetical protein EVAR_59103_1 [Eumeta japonica]|uniref:Uncharacterized protein n=1 Tax=Eumeta variegata TaxID=151549 RepID=A0A4C1YWC7_EUMVA|nr:hypothetical protein EVAR_59103_1 [Eumeta japonica]
MATFQLHHQTLPYSIKVLVKKNQTSPNLMGCVSFNYEFLWPPSSSINRPWLPYSIKVLSRNKRAQTRWGCVFNYGVPIHLPAPSSPWLPYSIKVLVKTNSNEPKLDGVVFNYGVPMATFQLHQQTLYHIVYQSTVKKNQRAQTRWVASFNYGVPMATFQLHHQTWLPYSIKVLVKKNQTSPNSMGLRRLITEFLWPPSSSIIRPWLPYSIKVLCQDESNEPKLDGVASFNYGVPMATSSIIRPWLPYSIKVLVKRIKRAQTRWGCRLITEFLWPPSSSIRPWL